MNTTQRGDDHQKDERQCLMIVKNGEIESGSWMCQCHKMCSQRVEVLEGNVVSTDKPIGHHESQERRQKGAKGKSQDVRAQDDPQDRDKIEYVHKGDAGQRQCSEGIEHPARSPSVLIGMEQKDEEADQSHLCPSNICRGQKETGSRRHHDK